MNFALWMASLGNNLSTSGEFNKVGNSQRDKTWRKNVMGFWFNAWGLPILQRTISSKGSELGCLFCFAIASVLACWSALITSSPRTAYLQVNAQTCSVIKWNCCKFNRYHIWNKLYSIANFGCVVRAIRFSLQGGYSVFKTFWDIEPRWRFLVDTEIY